MALLIASGGATVFAGSRGAFGRVSPATPALAATTDVEATSNEMFGPPPPPIQSSIPDAAVVDASAASDAGPRVVATGVRSAFVPWKRPVAPTLRDAGTVTPTVPIDAPLPTVLDDVPVEPSPTSDDSVPPSTL